MGQPVPREWRIREARNGERWRKRLGTRRKDLIEQRSAGIVVACMGLFWTVLPLVLFAIVRQWDADDLTGLAIWLVIGPACVALGRMMARDAHRGLRRDEDRIRLDGRDLWWGRHRRTGSVVVARADVVEVGLGTLDRTVVVRTVDGVERTVSDLGTRAERIALATAVGAAIGPGVARVRPELPPELPSRWVFQCDRPDGSVLVWRPRAWTATMPRWLVWAGRLEVDTGTPPRRVVALGLHRNPRTGRVRLHALLDDELRVVIASGWRDGRRITGFGRWLAERADVPLHEANAQ